MRFTAAFLMFLYGILMQLHPSASLHVPTSQSKSVCDQSGTSDCVPVSVPVPVPVPVPDISNFGTSLFAALSRSSPAGGNVLVSPLSVAQALALLMAGATPGSACETELRTALNVSFHADLPRLTDILLPAHVPPSGNTDDDDDDGVESDVSLTTANSAWLASAIKDEYADLATAVHSATAHELPPTYAPMNAWVTNATHSLIKDLFDPAESVDPQIRAFLLNVVHFKGSWTDRFHTAMTHEGTFRKSDGTEKSLVKFMYDRRHLRIGQGVETLGGASVVELTYGRLRKEKDEDGFEREVPSDFSALFVLPADGTAESMDGAIEAMTDQSLGDVLGGLRFREVELFLPRFKLEWGTSSLKESLRVLGVHEAFDGTNVLLGMSDDLDPPLRLDDVLHKGLMEVTEEGTVASATTFLTTTQPTSLIYTPPPPVKVEFDRPFVVAVVHVPTGTPVFLGRVEDPAFTFNSEG